MIKFHEVEIKCSDFPDPDFKFTIDGREIRYVRSVQIEVGMDGPPVVHVEFIAHVRGQVRGIVKGKAMRFTET